MSNITTYPGIPVVAGEDLMIISDISTKGNPTKSVSVSQLGNFIGASGGGAGVATVNGLFGALTLIPGANVTFTTVGNNITINSANTVGTVTSVAATFGGNAFALTGSPITASGTLAITPVGSNTQYVNGAGNLATTASLPVNLAPLEVSRTSGQATWNPTTKVLDIPNYSGEITSVTNHGSDGDAEIVPGTKILNIPNYNSAFTDIFFEITVPASGIPALTVYRNTTGSTLSLAYSAAVPGDYVITSNINLFTSTKRWHFTVMNPNIIAPISGTGLMPMPTVCDKKIGVENTFAVSTFNHNTGTISGGKANIPSGGLPVSVELKFFTV
jgi:hypothetical protein